MIDSIPTDAAAMMSAVCQKHVRLAFINSKQYAFACLGAPEEFSLRLSFHPSTWVVEEQLRSLPFIQFMSNIGGTLGIWTGSSFISLIHLFVVLINLLWKQLKKKHAQNQVGPNANIEMGNIP